MAAYKANLSQISWSNILPSNLTLAQGKNVDPFALRHEVFDDEELQALAKEISDDTPLDTNKKITDYAYALLRVLDRCGYLEQNSFRPTNATHYINGMWKISYVAGQMESFVSVYLDEETC